MKNEQSVIQKTDWGDAKEIFNQHLPKILECYAAGQTRRKIHQTLNIGISYRQFCRHLKRHLNSSTLSTQTPSNPETTSGSNSAVTITAAASVAGSSFSIPKVSFGEDSTEEDADG